MKIWRLYIKGEEVARLECEGDTDLGELLANIAQGAGADPDEGWEEGSPDLSPHQGTRLVWPARMSFEDVEDEDADSTS